MGLGSMLLPEKRLWVVPMVSLGFSLDQGVDRFSTVPAKKLLTVHDCLPDASKSL